MSDKELSREANSSEMDSDDYSNLLRKREDEDLLLSMEKDFRHYESIRVKAQYYTGIIAKVKNLNPQGMENVCKAFEQDNDL